MSWGEDRYALLLLHLKTRLAKPAQMVSDSLKSTTKGVFILKRKITFNQGQELGLSVVKHLETLASFFPPLQSKDRRG